MAEKKQYEFCEAIRVFAPNEKAQSFILANVKIDAAAMIEWLTKKLESGDESVRFDLRVTDPTRTFVFPTWAAAKPFMAVNTWKPKPRGDYDASGATPTPGADSDLPF
jgi:hypothetical protein